MTAKSATIHYKSCNGKINNHFAPNCTAISPGEYGTPGDGDKAAAEAGWTQDNNKDYCPMCSAGRTSAPEAAKPDRKSRAVKTSTPVVDPAPEYAQ